MPYSGPEDKSLPAVVRALPEKKRKQWVAVWNSAYTKCKEQGGDDCEKSAFAQANGVAEMTTDFIFIDLASPSGEPIDRPFDGMVPGEFRDMYRRQVSIQQSDMEVYLANTLSAIQATKAESGELVGLPIDAYGHDKGDGAGWIVDAQLSSAGKMRLTPKWTDLGRELIGKNRRRFFSPTVDTEEKIVLGGSLTNWPASRDKKGRVMLKPIELSEGIFTVEPQGAFQQVMDGIRELVGWNSSDADLSDPGDTSLPLENQTPIEEDIMTVELTDEVKTYLSDAISESIAQAFVKAGNPPEPKSGNGEGQATGDEFDLIATLGLGSLEKEAQERIESALQEHFQTVQKQAELAYLQKLSAVNRKREVAELAARVTGGSEEAPRGLPVQADELAIALMKLPADQFTFWRDLCQTTVKSGLIEFQEAGHGKQVEGTRSLPEEVARMLDAGEFKLADLSEPVLGLGDLSQYDLSKWKEK